jgi:hypothetical protein
MHSWENSMLAEKKTTFRLLDKNLSCFRIVLSYHHHDQCARHRHPTAIQPPWHPTGECNYGGKVTDAHDRHTLMTVLSTYYTPQVVDTPGYAFSPSGLYFAPPDADYAGYLDHIRALPLLSAPEVMVMVMVMVLLSGCCCCGGGGVVWCGVVWCGVVWCGVVWW